MVKLGGGSRIDDLFCHSLRDISAPWLGGGRLTGCDQECVDAPTPCFVCVIEVPTGVCSSWD